MINEASREVELLGFDGEGGGGGVGRCGIRCLG